jgi:hypothetical protein
LAGFLLIFSTINVKKLPSLGEHVCPTTKNQRLKPAWRLRLPELKWSWPWLLGTFLAHGLMVALELLLG